MGAGAAARSHLQLALHSKPGVVAIPVHSGEIVKQGETIEECIERDREAIALHIEGLIAHGLPVPEGEDVPIITIDVDAPAA